MRTGTPGRPRSRLDGQRVGREPQSRAVVHARHFGEQPRLPRESRSPAARWAGASRAPRQVRGRAGFQCPGLARRTDTVAGACAAGGRRCHAPCTPSAARGRLSCRDRTSTSVRNVDVQDVLGVDARALGDALDLGQELHVGGVEPRHERCPHDRARRTRRAPRSARRPPRTARSSAWTAARAASP